mmetsp:Transcript_28749/g.39738  ORF Transcript_28749/g.39738 Transcript_28749/m.39738 type:complete len:210 (+) Transcript_28749:466-1095(+)
MACANESGILKPSFESETLATGASNEALTSSGTISNNLLFSTSDSAPNAAPPRPPIKAPRSRAARGRLGNAAHNPLAIPAVVIDEAATLDMQRGSCVRNSLRPQYMAVAHPTPTPPTEAFRPTIQILYKRIAFLFACCGKRNVDSLLIRINSRVPITVAPMQVPKIEAPKISANSGGGGTSFSSIGCNVQKRDSANIVEAFNCCLRKSN